MAEPRLEQIGRATRFFARPSVAVIALTAPLRVGDRLFIKGHTTDAQEVVRSMQLEQRAITAAQPGSEVGAHTSARCRPGDTVFRVIG